MGKTKMPERETFHCAQEPEDSLTFLGPDPDGDLSIEIDATDDSFILNAETAKKVYAFIGRYLEKVEGE